MIEVLLFATRDDPDEGWGRVHTLAALLRADGLSVTVIDRLSSKYEDLLLLVQHGIAQTPFFILKENSAVLWARHGVPSARKVRSLLTPTDTPP